MGFRIAAIVTVIAVLMAILYASRLHHGPLKVSGFIEADEVRVGSRVGGRVKSVPVDEGQVVKSGDLLVELEPFDLNEQRMQALSDLESKKQKYAQVAGGYRKEQVAQAQAKRDQLAANLEKLKAGPRKQEIAAGQANVQFAEAQFALAQSNYDRISKSGDAASRDEMEEATEDLKSATARLEVRREELSQLNEGTRAEDIAQAEAALREADQAFLFMSNGYDPEEIAAGKAAVEQASAAAAAIDKQIAELKVVAPIDGEVEAVDLEPGDLVAPNAPVLSILDTKEYWVRAYVPENQLDLKIGQKLQISVDSFPDRKFAGHITFVARQAEFTPGNVQTPEERSKQVFRIKVTLDEGADILRAGMAADVWLE